MALTDTSVWVLTGGAIQFMDWKFWDKYVYEVWVVLDKEFLNKGVLPRGFNLKTLQIDLKPGKDRGRLRPLHTNSHQSPYLIDLTS